jgi:hypothetical protein
MVASAAICFTHREFVWPNCTAHNIQSVERVPMTQSGIAKLAWIVLMMIDLLATSCFGAFWTPVSLACGASLVPAPLDARLVASAPERTLAPWLSSDRKSYGNLGEYN